MGHISQDVYILSVRDLEERERRAFLRGVERGKFEENMRRGEARVAINCAHWNDGYCDHCGAQTQSMQISAEYKCPHFLPRSAAPTTDGWQPIETAPKNQTLFVGWFDSLGKWRSDHGTYYGPREFPFDDYAIEDCESDKDYAEPGWYGGGLEAEQLYRIFPTHWCALPAAPTPSTASDGQ